MNNSSYIKFYKLSTNVFIYIYIFFFKLNMHICNIKSVYILDGKTINFNKYQICQFHYSGIPIPRYKIVEF